MASAVELVVKRAQLMPLLQAFAARMAATGAIDASSSGWVGKVKGPQTLRRPFTWTRRARPACAALRG